MEDEMIRGHVVFWNKIDQRIRDKLINDLTLEKYMDISRAVGI